ncbi:MAG: class I SAM-dependent methyltransferase, partial [Leptospiraceae bacterium]|nr:class I SAM-dependent methyltransferase [Leptospiraceae bacterium]
MLETYTLIDSGDLAKLEIVGKYKIIRPSLFSVYKKTNKDLWKNPDAVFAKTEKGGEWKFFSRIPESFSIEICGLTAKIKFTPFGHLGIFPEQGENWNLIRKISEKKKNLEVLNLFAYSGLSTLACLDSNYSVCHVDASKGMVDWAKENAKLSGLSEKKVRWIVDDVLKFLKREIKRGKKYQGFVLDPPTFGRGSKGEVWKIEDDLVPLLELCME